MLYLYNLTAFPLKFKSCLVKCSSVWFTKTALCLNLKQFLIYEKNLCEFVRKEENTGFPANRAKMRSLSSWMKLSAWSWCQSTSCMVSSSRTDWLPTNWDKRRARRWSPGKRNRYSLVIMEIYRLGETLGGITVFLLALRRTLHLWLLSAVVPKYWSRTYHFLHG